MQTIEVHSGADIHLQPWEDPTLEQVDALKQAVTLGKSMLEQAPARTCEPMERGAYTGADLLAGLVTLQATHAGADCS